jgi:hypothetical protein
MEINRQNQKEEAPFAHYLEIYRSLDPGEIAERCALPFDGNAFSLTLLGADYLAPHPAFALIPREDAASSAPPAHAGRTARDILILRYLCGGRYLSGSGGRLSYNDIPWGPVYYRNFEGRCLKRLAYTFGNDIPRFRRIIETTPGLKAEKLPQGDAGFRIEFLSGLYISLILYAADDEFPPSAQMLFDDNLVFAFTAEDLAAVGEIIIDTLIRS